MANIKAGGIHWMRKYLQQKGPAIELAVRESLTGEERQAYDVSLASSWLPLEMYTHLYQKAAAVVFPGPSSLGLRELDRLHAHNDLTGIYKILLRTATVPFVIKQAATVWTTYHAQGEAHVERIDSNQADFVVKGYPSLYPPAADIVAGYIIGVMELAGAKQIQVVNDLSDLHAITWHIAYR